MIIIDGENSFLNFPTIPEMTPEAQKYMADNGLGEINHQVLSVSNRPGAGTATLSFNELDVSAWHNMLPSLRAGTEGQLITILQMTFNILRREGREISTANIRHYAQQIAEASNMIHRSQIPAIVRALHCPELDLFDDTNLTTVLNPEVLFQPGLITTINVNSLDMNRRRVVTLYILELLHRYKVLDRINDPGVVVAIDECESLYPHKPTAREREFVDRIAERTAAVTMLGRKRYYSLFMVTHLTSDVSPEVVKLVSNHMAFRCSGGEDKHISTYIGPEFVDEINSLQTGFCRMKTNTSTVVQSGTNATIKLPFVGFATDLTIVDTT
ncbi:MAG: hypothetical protein VX199_06800, partial [Chloroflexota bacterium]|nr:hypothetical protein [Chloroflexota bacterium]